MDYSKKDHEIEHFESASKTEQVVVGVADRNRNVSAKYALLVSPSSIADNRNSKSSTGPFEGNTLQYFGQFLCRTWVQR